MSLVFAKFHIPTIEEIKDYGYKLAEAEITEDLVKLVKEETTLSADDLAGIMDLARGNFNVDHKKDILDAMEWYKDASKKMGLFEGSKFGDAYTLLEISVEYSKKNFHIDKTVDKDKPNKTNESCGRDEYVLLCNGKESSSKEEENKTDNDVKEQNEIAEWLSHKDGHCARFEVYAVKA